MKSSVCQESTSLCYFSKCTKCPRTDNIINKLELLLDNHEINKITYSQWKSTDR